MVINPAQVKIAEYVTTPTSSDAATVAAARQSKSRPNKIVATPLAVSSGPATKTEARNLARAIHQGGMGLSTS